MRHLLDKWSRSFRAAHVAIGSLCVHQTTIAPVDKRDEAKVIATLVSAFIADPVERWLFAEPLQYLTQFGRFVEAFGSGGFERETVFSLENFAAVAIWIP